MKITLISDTHGKHKQIEKDLPGGDLIIHAGDFMNSGYDETEAFQFLSWFDQLEKYDTKVFIAGNHDRLFEIDPEWATGIITGYKNIDYLIDERMETWDQEDQPVTFYGSPWQPEFYNWAFNLPRNGEEMKGKWDAIPSDTDILITHGPPFGHLDIPGGQNIQVGCEMLRYRVDEIRPKIHVFGHIHGGHGYYFNGHTHFFNASVLNERYMYTNLPFSFEWDPITNEITFNN
jgi:Icc-related predicted phosphoesterase